MLNEDDEDREPGVPGRDTDEDGRPYFFPRNRRRAADLSEQREGFTSRWEYRGHQHDAEGAVKSVCVSGEDALGRMRVVSTDGSSIHSWLELSDDDTVKTVDGVQNVTSITLVVGLDVLAASSVRIIYQDFRDSHMLIGLRCTLNTTSDRIATGCCMHNTP